MTSNNDDDDDSLILVDMDDFLDPIDADDIVPIEEVQKAIEKVSYVRKSDPEKDDAIAVDREFEPPINPPNVRSRARVKLKPGRKPTGRNDLLGIQATTDVKERFKRVTQDNNWALGETLQYALEALERELEQGATPGKNEA